MEKVDLYQSALVYDLVCQSWKSGEVEEVVSASILSSSVFLSISSRIGRLQNRLTILFQKNIVSNMSTFTAAIKHLSDRQKIALFPGLEEVARDLSQQHISKQN